MRSDLLENELSAKVIDFGVYASLGTKVMLELSLANIKAGDVVLLAPEVSAQTYSDYFNPDVLWEAADENVSMLKYLGFGEKVKMAFHYFKFAVQKMRFSGEKLTSDDDLYARRNFNSYGDLSYPRPYNIMPSGADASQPVVLEGLIGDPFVQMVNDYAKELKKRGADLYFVFSPINEKAVAYSPEEADDFEDLLCRKLDCEVLGTLSGSTYPSGYFYNTNYHLNDAGAILHTATLAKLLKPALGLGDGISIEIPVSPEIPAPEDVGYDENEAFFTYESVGSAVFVSGVLPEYRNLTELTLPRSHDKRAVSGILASAFSGCEKLRTIRIPDNYRSFEAGCFAGCPALSDIYLELDKPGLTAIPARGLFDGTPNGLNVWVPSNAYTAYSSNYSWRQYKQFLKKLPD